MPLVDHWLKPNAEPEVMAYPKPVHGTGNLACR